MKPVYTFYLAAKGSKDELNVYLKLVIINKKNTIALKNL
jgi:hypothetical protein